MNYKHEKMEFEKLLDETSDLDPRLRLLWSEIYKNAIFDRDQAGVFLSNMTPDLGQSAQTHLAFGPQATKYMELVRKSNDQLLKLSEQIRLYREEKGDIDTDNILDEIDAASKR